MFSTAPQEPVHGDPTKVVEREMNLTTGKIQTHNPFEWAFFQNATNAALAQMFLNSWHSLVEAVVLG